MPSVVLTNLVFALFLSALITESSFAISCSNLLTQSKVHRAIEKSEKSLNLLLELGLIKKSEFKHYKEDLLAGQDQINAKKHHKSFQEVLNKWETFFLKIDSQLDSFQSYSKKDKELWKEKMKTLLFFNVGHFVTFLESSDVKVYQKSNAMLDRMISLPENADLKIYLFEMEKEVMKYFSLKEFKKCKF